MNERIRELAEQADIKFESHPQHQGIDTAVITPSDLEKFAELIVKECFKAAMIEAKGHMNPIDLMKRMKERVGVEE